MLVTPTAGRLYFYQCINYGPFRLGTIFRDLPQEKCRSRTTFAGQPAAVANWSRVAAAVNQAFNAQRRGRTRRQNIRRTARRSRGRLRIFGYQARRKVCVPRDGLGLSRHHVGRRIALLAESAADGEPSYVKWAACPNGMNGTNRRAQWNLEASSIAHQCVGRDSNPAAFTEG